MIVIAWTVFICGVVALAFFSFAASVMAREAFITKDAEAAVAFVGYTLCFVLTALIISAPARFLW